MKIGELSERSGLSTHTIRYYERIGLLPYADRDAGGRRDYDPSILTWIGFLHRLKATDMSINDMLKIAELRLEGDHTGPQRRAILEAHREAVRDKIVVLQDCLSMLDTKIAGYTAQETEKNDEIQTVQSPISG